MPLESLYKYQKTNLKFAGSIVFRMFFDGQLVGFRYKESAYKLTKNGKEVRCGSKYTPFGFRNMTLEEQWDYMKDKEL